MPMHAQPKMTIVLVIDQLSYQNLYNLKEHFNFGLKKLIENGINYHAAYHTHGSPATAAGHASIGTGTCAKDHGFVLNALPQD